MKTKQNILIILILLFTSCATLKKKNELKKTTDTNTLTKETITRYQPADTTYISVPNIVYKDTTIIKKGRTNTAYLNFNSNGNIDFKCINDKIQETIQRTIEESKKEDVKINTKEKETIVSEKMIIYSFIGIVVLIIVNKLINKFI